MTSTFANLIYITISALAVGGWIAYALVRVCNAYARPDDALAWLMRAGYRLVHWAQTGQAALAHQRYVEARDRAQMAEAMQPRVWREQ